MLSFKILTPMYIYMYITHSVMVVLVTVGKPDISSLIGLDTYHHVMVRIEKIHK